VNKYRFKGHVKTDEKMFVDLEVVDGVLVIKWPRPRLITAPFDHEKYIVGPFIYYV